LGQLRNRIRKRKKRLRRLQTTSPPAVSLTRHANNMDIFFARAQRFGLRELIRSLLRNTTAFNKRNVKSIYARKRVNVFRLFSKNYSRYSSSALPLGTSVLTHNVPSNKSESQFFFSFFNLFRTVSPRTDAQRRAVEYGPIFQS